MSKKIRVGLVGYGYAGKTFHAPLLAGTPGMILAAICSSNAGKVKADWPAINVLKTPEALINDAHIDLIVIATPNDTHFPLAKAALEAGKNVVVDKPFTVTLSQARELEALAISQNRLLSVFHNRRWDGDFLTISDLINRGVLGDVVSFESHFDRYRPAIRTRWREQTGSGTGLWFDLGPHLIDQALMLFGKPISINADLAALRPGAQTTDYFHTVLIYPERRIILHASMLAARESARFILHGTRGSYIKYGLDPQEDQLKACVWPPQQDWGYDRRDGELTLAADDKLENQQWKTKRGNYPAYYTAIWDALNNEGDNPVPVSQAITVMEIIELGIASAQQHATLALNQ